MIYAIPDTGEALHAARREKGLTQNQIAESAAVKQATVSEAERGADLRVSTLQRIAGALDLRLMLVPRQAFGIVRQVVKEIQG